MLRTRAKTHYSVEVEKVIYHVQAWSLKEAVEEGMTEYYEAIGYPNLVGNPINFNVKVTNVTSKKMYTFNVAAKLSMHYDIMKEKI